MYWEAIYTERRRGREKDLQFPSGHNSRSCTDLKPGTQSLLWVSHVVKGSKAVLDGFPGSQAGSQMGKRGSGAISGAHQGFWCFQSGDFRCQTMVSSPTLIFLFIIVELYIEAINLLCIRHTHTYFVIRVTYYCSLIFDFIVIIIYKECQKISCVVLFQAFTKLEANHSPAAEVSTILSST